MDDKCDGSTSHGRYTSIRVPRITRWSKNENKPNGDFLQPLRPIELHWTLQHGQFCQPTKIDLRPRQYCKSLSCSSPGTLYHSTASSRPSNPSHRCRCRAVSKAVGCRVGDPNHHWEEVQFQLQKEKRINSSASPVVTPSANYLRHPHCLLAFDALSQFGISETRMRSTAELPSRAPHVLFCPERYVLITVFVMLFRSIDVFDLMVGRLLFLVGSPAGSDE